MSHAVGPADPPVRDITLGDLLREAAEAAPDRVALIEGVADPTSRRRWTYRELHDDAVRAARAIALRFSPGERVAVWAQNIPEWVVLEFGCALAGVVLVTVNPTYRRRELGYVLEHSGAAGLFVVREFRNNPMLATAESVAAECPELREIVRLDDWSGFLASADRFEDELPTVDPVDPMMIQYTSGTTGSPKGALLHHRGLANNGAHVAGRMGVSDGSVFVTMMPLFHTGGSVMCVLGCVARRATQVLVEAFEPGLVLELLDTYGVQAMLAVPTMLVAMLEHPDLSSTDLSRLQAMA
ncbi:MAG: AMP-binding protein, partial [Acidimicrobiales bacterium]